MAFRSVVASGVFLLICSAQVLCLQVNSQLPASANPPVRQIGTVKSIAGDSLTLSADSGAVINVIVQDSARLLRIAPGQTDLKGAALIHLEEIQVGDRILVRGSNSDDTKSMLASSVILMKQSEIAERQQQKRADWQKRGVGGLVNTVDAANGAITISTGIGASKTIVIHTSKDTILRRYAPNSVQFDDAKPGTFEQIKAGDQLRALGSLDADGTQISAEEIVSGTFRNIAGTILSVDTRGNSISVLDLSTKKATTIKLGADSQMRKLPPMLAQRVAARLKGKGAPPGTAGEHATTGQSRGGTLGARGGEAPDLQQILQRLPTTTLTDLNKGDAVMIVATLGTDLEQPTVITLLSGVEPILTASPSNNGAALSTWNLASSIGDATMQ